MKCTVQFDKDRFPARLSMFIYGAPHKRAHAAVHKDYRRCVVEACHKAGVPFGIDYPIDLYVVFIDPTSPDLDHLLEGLYRTLDGKGFKGKKALSVLEDDDLIHKVEMMKMFTGHK